MVKFNVQNDFPRTCLPDDLDTEFLIDATTICSEFRKFVDLRDGTVHDCEKYFHMAINQHSHVTAMVLS